MNENTKKIISLSNGKRPSVEIAAIVGLSPRYVRKVMKRHNLPRLGEGAQLGQHNHQFESGRRIGTDGYVLVTAPEGHKSAYSRTHRKTLLIKEHRLVLERSLGRYLAPEEVVDHIDGLTLHNAPENLRAFPDNAAHLRATLAERAPKLSLEGAQNTGIRTDLGQVCQPVDSYRLRRKRGEIRLQQILLAALSLGIGSPYLLGTHKWLELAGIDPASHPSLEHALADLYQKWGWDQTQ